MLSEVEAKFWDLIQRPQSVEALREACRECTDALIRDFLQSGFCELVEPTFPSDRRPVLVIEPHADDAALSIGGIMWLQRLKCCFVVATMASRSNHTIYYNLRRDYFDIEEVTKIRCRESELFARMIGGAHVSVGLTDAALRYRDSNWTLDFFLRHRTSISAGISRVADGDVRKQWSQAVGRLLAENPSAEVWVPLGGPHADHVLTIDACLEAFLSDPSSIMGRVLRIYQEVPYVARFPRYMNDSLEALRKAGALLEQEVIPIDEAYEQKLRLASIYASQNIQSMREDIEASARVSGSATRFAEILWTMRTLPDGTHPSAIMSVAIARLEQEEAVAAWVSKHRDAQYVRVILVMPSGRWAADLKLLCAAFPRARFEVYVTRVAAAEVIDVKSDRVTVRKVAGGVLAFFFLSLRLAAAMKPSPTLFHVRSRRLRAARLVSRLWLGSDTLIIASMDRLASVLRARDVR